MGSEVMVIWVLGDFFGFLHGGGGGSKWLQWKWQVVWVLGFIWILGFIWVLDLSFCLGN